MCFSDGQRSMRVVSRCPVRKRPFFAHVCTNRAQISTLSSKKHIMASETLSIAITPRSVKKSARHSLFTRRCEKSEHAATIPKFDTRSLFVPTSARTRRTTLAVVRRSCGDGAARPWRAARKVTRPYTIHTTERKENIFHKHTHMCIYI